MVRPTVFEFAGGERAFLALATAHHERCLQDPELNHPFSHPGQPDHLERLAAYWGEVFGGPARYTERWGGHSAMLEVHARTGAGEDFGPRFVACFVAAADDAGLPEDLELRDASAATWSGLCETCSHTRRRTRRCRKRFRSDTGDGPVPSSYAPRESFVQDS